ncbi:hypothetical protein ACOMHN_013595 [Nucella lapillus]
MYNSPRCPIVDSRTSVQQSSLTNSRQQNPVQEPLSLVTFRQLLHPGPSPAVLTLSCHWTRRIRLPTASCGPNRTVANNNTPAHHAAWHPEGLEDKSSLPLGNWACFPLKEKKGR